MLISAQQLDIKITSFNDVIECPTEKFYKFIDTYFVMYLFSHFTPNENFYCQLKFY